MNRKQNHQNRKYIILAIVFVVLALIFGGIALYQHLHKKQAEDKQETLVKDTIDTEEEDYDADIYAKTGVKMPKRDIDWDALAEENADIYAWIYIPGTEIDYPMLQKEGDDDYYLDHNVDGSNGYPGCIYTQASYNSPDLTDNNTLIYGHDMKDGSMFAGLHDFEDETFFNENRYIIIYTPEVTHVYEIFAAYTFTDAHILATYDCDDTTSFEHYLNMVKAISTDNTHFSENINEVDAQDRIITLSTCISYAPNNRWLVQGVELE